MARRDKGGAAATDAGIAVAAHPRARASIRRWRGRAGLLGLVVATWLSLRAGVPGFDAVARGLACGIAAQFVAWAAAVVAWRHLVVAELAVARTDVQRRRKSPQVVAAEADHPA